MPEYRLIFTNTADQTPEIIDLEADDLESVLAFLRRQTAQIKPPAELWSEGKLLLVLSAPKE